MDIESTSCGLEVPHGGLDSKFQANCALFDTSMKFGTSIVVTNMSISDIVPSWTSSGFHGNNNLSKFMNVLCSYPILAANTFISMLPTYLPSLIWLSIWHVAFKVRVAMETKN